MKGTSGEEWVTPLEKVMKTYTLPDGSAIESTDFIPDEYIEIRTISELGTNLTVNDVYWVSGFSIYPVNNLLQKGWSCYSCDNMSFIMYPSDRSTIIKKAKIKFK